MEFTFELDQYNFEEDKADIDENYSFYFLFPQYKYVENKNHKNYNPNSLFRISLSKKHLFLHQH